MGEQSEVEDLRRDYRTAFLRYLPQRDESALAAAYDLGRSTVSRGISVLIVTQLHHQVLRELVSDSSPEEVDALLEHGAEFLAEVLGSVEMMQRGLRD